jgi:hypothetical protein
MARSTKPVRVDKDDAKLIQDLAEDRDARPAEIVSELVAELDDEDLVPETVGACPLCGYEFRQDETKSPLLASDDTVKCPDPDDQHRETGSTRRFRVSNLDDV